MTEQSVSGRAGVDGLVWRSARADFGVWRRQVERAGFCERPVRVVGGSVAVDGVRGEFASGGQPDGVVLLACGDRRVAVCGPCAGRYRADMWHVVAAGMAGRDMEGTEVPASVAGHPAVFVTLTAPSFGAVHSCRDGGVCRPRRGGGRCVHGRPVGCGVRHDESDPLVGTPLCSDCWDYEGAVVWNAMVPQLWRRTRIAMERALAPLVSEVLGRRVGVRGVRGLLRLHYVKVAEFQRRGLVHLHVVVRLDGAPVDGDDGGVVAPPSWAGVGLLGAAVSRGVGAAGLGVELGGELRPVAWGDQVDVRAVDPDADPRKVAGYLAKYSVKSAGGDAGVLARRLRRLDVGAVRAVVGGHVARLVECAWRLGADPGWAGLRRWAHQLGFGGHVATKSRRWSVTMAALRLARRRWRARQSGDDAWVRDDTVVVGSWRFAGQGFIGSADAGIVAGWRREHEIARWEYRNLLAEERRIRAEVDIWDVAA